MRKYLAVLLVIFTGIVIGNDIFKIYHNTKLPWESFWDVLLISSPGDLFEAITALILGVTSYHYVKKE